MRHYTETRKPKIPKLDGICHFVKSLTDLARATTRSAIAADEAFNNLSLMDLRCRQAQYRQDMHNLYRKKAPVLTVADLPHFDSILPGDAIDLCAIDEVMHPDGTCEFEPVKWTPKYIKANWIKDTVKPPEDESYSVNFYYTTKPSNRGCTTMTYAKLRETLDEIERSRKPWPVDKNTPKGAPTYKPKFTLGPKGEILRTVEDIAKTFDIPKHVMGDIMWPIHRKPFQSRIEYAREVSEHILNNYIKHY